MLPSWLWHPVQHYKNRWIKCPTKLNSVGFPHIASVKVVCYLIECDPVTPRWFLSVDNIHDKMSQTLTADTFSHLIETNGYKYRPHFVCGLHQRSPVFDVLYTEMSNTQTVLHPSYRASFCYNNSWNIMHSAHCIFCWANKTTTLHQFVGITRACFEVSPVTCKKASNLDW